jgi:hypothetical protein
MGTAGPAWAWGPVGHETVAYIAEDNLVPSAKKRVDAILGPDLDLAAVANWADQVRESSRPETAPWHFIDIEDRVPETEAKEPQFCANHDCVVDQINADIAALRSSASTKAQKFEALKFLVHFVGDVHQPLHCADDSDRGGNDKIVRYIKSGGRSTTGTKIKLHAFWDRLLEVKTTEDARDLATELEAKIGSAESTAWKKGTPADWAWETFGIAHDAIYSEFDPGAIEAPGIPLPRDYYAPKMRTTVDTQLEKGGIRLAQILNDLFGP